MGTIESSQTLREIFETLDVLPWNFVLYVPFEPLGLESMCLVCDPNDIESGDEIPLQAKRLGLIEGLGVDDIKSIRENARLQGRRPTLEEMLKAFSHYLKNDAYHTFDNDTQ